MTQDNKNILVNQLLYDKGILNPWQIFTNTCYIVSEQYSVVVNKTPFFAAFLVSYNKIGRCIMKNFKNFDLKNASWIKIGGPAAEFIEVENTDEFVSIVGQMRKTGTPFEVLGWGANSLISDRGLDLTVIKDKTNFIEIGDVIAKTDSEENVNFENENELRHKSFKTENITSGYDYEDINYSEADAEDILVTMSAGVSLPYAINFLIDKGVTGLQMFSGIPGTIGGSVFNNIHGGPRLLSEYLDSVTFIDKQGNVHTLSKKELELGYNQSRFQINGDIIVSATFRLKLGDKNKARFAAIEWAKRKSTQPRNSLGSTFHNLTPEQQADLGVPTPSIAYLIEHKLKLSGTRIGGIMIPEQTPADQPQKNKNIFMNVDHGTAEDYLNLMKLVYRETYNQYGIKLKPEIFFKGFQLDEIKEFIH
jgi:UDP-N-acetylenolpyruvoylglucosamine reductase